ncbi:MAG TPA: hypothetical protein VFH68_23175 [Polyangia bacterium]|jgi:hypothetical protein|nr:hypothetical protein [Polyangia bacterium]
MKAPGVRRAGATLALVIAIGVLPAAAFARSALVVPYPIGDVWPATVRFLRVDHDYPIKEKDEPAGYLLFELAENRRAYRAAFELVKTTDGDGRAATQIVCTIADLPRRYEASLLDKLSAKVRDERGPPATPPPRKAPAGQDKKPEGKPDSKPPPGDISELPRPPTLELPRQ